VLPLSSSKDAKAGDPNGNSEVHWQRDADHAGEGSHDWVAGIADRVAALQRPRVTIATASGHWVGRSSDGSCHKGGRDKMNKGFVKHHRE
jgi:hypothetical protein